MAYSDLSNFIKENPIKSLSAFVTIITVVVSMVYFLEDRYALKIELNTIKAEWKTDRKEMFNSLSNLIMMQYEDEIMDLEFKVRSGKATAYEETKLDHLKRRVDQMRR